MNTDTDSIEKDIIWRKLNGSYHPDKDLHTFITDGCKDCFYIPSKSPKFITQVTSNGHLLDPLEYMVDMQVNGMILKCVYPQSILAVHIDYY